METYYGYVRTPADAIKLFEACRLGLLPRVQRRLSEKERQSIRSGSVFVWDEREAGMRRWTDGKSWSASRVSGSFLTYREMEGKRGGGFGASRRGSGKTPESGRASDEDHDEGEPEGYRYKADGLMKQSFSITTSTGQHLHLISYYSRPQPGQADLPQPTNDSALRSIVPVKGMYPESSMGETSQTPALTRAPMQQPPPYGLPPQHHYPTHQPPHAAPYPHSGGYGWPPSPAATPPYSHYSTASYQHSGQPVPPYHGHAGPPHYAPASQYEHRAALPLPAPLPTPQKPSTSSQHHHRHPGQYRMPSPPRINDLSKEQVLRAAAQAVVAGQHHQPPAAPARSSQGPQGPLPALTAVTGGPAGSSLASVAAQSPPCRGQSLSPPQSSCSEPNNASRSSLTSLLHAAKDCYQVGDSGIRTGCAPPVEAGSLSEDTRALRMLDRSAFRQVAL